MNLTKIWAEPLRCTESRSFGTLVWTVKYVLTPYLCPGYRGWTLLHVQKICRTQAEVQ